MGAEEGLDLLTRMAACSPEQLLSLFPFTLGYDDPVSWLVFQRRLCSGNAKWKMFYFVSDRKVTAMVCHYASSFTDCIATSIPVLLVLSPGGEIPLNPFGST